MIDVDETFCQAPLGHVIEHQRKVTVAQVQAVLGLVLAFNQGSYAVVKSMEKFSSFSNLGVLKKLLSFSSLEKSGKIQHRERK